MSKSYQIVPNIMCLQAFQHTSIKNQIVFEPKLSIFLFARSCGNHSKSIGFLCFLLCQTRRFHATARCNCVTPVMRPRHESFAKNPTRAACAHRRARMISLTGFLNSCARGLPLQRCHHHRDHLPHGQMAISFVNVFAIIGAVIPAPSSS